MVAYIDISEGDVLLKSHGHINSFAIKYKLLPSPYNETGILGESWGEFELWCNGKSICQYEYDGKVENFRWSLIYIVEWLCGNLEYIIGYDPFPLPIDGESTLDLIKLSNDFQSADDEEYLWFQARSLWISRHSWISNSDGAPLSCVYFRRIKNKIEIAWENDIHDDLNIKFNYYRGVSYVDRYKFIKVVVGFINDFLSELKNNLSDEYHEEKELLDELQRNIRIIISVFGIK